MIALNVNGRPQQVDVEPDTPLLWVLRDALDLTGTKYGCGIAQCGACTVHLDGQPVRACVTPVTTAVGKKVTTIEGLDPRAEHPLQRAWVAEQVPQRQMLPARAESMSASVGLGLAASSAAADMICPDWQ